MGHLGLADNYMMKLFDSEGDVRPEGFEKLFWFGSKPIAEDSQLPPIDEVRKYFDDRRENLMNILEKVSEQEMEAPIPPDSPFKFPSMGQIFAFNAMHEGIHFGQLTVCHRGLGNQPLYGP